MAFLEKEVPRCAGGEFQYGQRQGSRGKRVGGNEKGIFVADESFRPGDKRSAGGVEISHVGDFLISRSGVFFHIFSF